MAWYLRSIRDRDTHRGEITADGQVTATCGAVFTPYLLPQGGRGPAGTRAVRYRAEPQRRDVINPK